jgi:hypothetical protein
MRLPLFLAVAALAAPLAFADAPKSAPAEETAPIYKVIKQDASIFAANRRVDNYWQGEDGSLILRAGVREWYRVEVWQPCRSDLRWEQAVGLRPGATGSFDRFSDVIVNGKRCAVERIDQIEDPRPVDKALREKAKAEKSAS